MNTVVARDWAILTQIPFGFSVGLYVPFISFYRISHKIRKRSCDLDPRTVAVSTSQRVISSIRLFGCVGPLRLLPLPDLPFPIAPADMGREKSCLFSFEATLFYFVSVPESPCESCGLVPRTVDRELSQDPPADPCVRFLYSCLYVSPSDRDVRAPVVTSPQPSPPLGADTVVVSLRLIQKSPHSVLPLVLACSRLRMR